MFASSQTYLRPNTSYGLQLYRIAPDSILHLPKINDLLLHTTYTTLPQLRTIGDSLWFYNGTYWANMNRIATAGSATWGGIGGVITDQLDLIARFGTKVDTGRTITINGITQSLSANRTYTVGTVDSVSVGPLNPLFTTTVATNSTHPIVVFSQISQPAYTIFGNNAGSSAVPSFFIPTLASAMFQNQGSATTVLHGNAAGNPSWAAVNLATDVTGTLPGTSVGFTANQSVIITGSNITLRNDQATPDTFNFYGTDSVAALGYHPSQPSQLADPQDNDDVKVKFISGRPFFVNQPSINQCQTRWVSGLDVTRIGTTHSFFVSPGQYYIGCDLKIWNGGLVTIPDVVSLAKQTWIIVDAAGANIVDGQENADPQLESLNLDTQIPRASVLVNADNSIDVSQLVIYNENTESTMATGGTITVNFGSAGNTANGSVKIAVTAAANNAYWQATYPSTLLIRSYDNLAFSIWNVNALNANSNWSIQLYLNNTVVSQELNITGYGYTRGANTGYQNIVIPTTAFTGGNSFNRVRVRRKGTGGTINTRFDLMYLEQGVTVINPPSQTSLLFGRLDNGTKQEMRFNYGGHSFVQDSVNKLIFNISNLSDTAFVIRGAGGDMLRVNANTNTVYINELDMVGGKLHANASALVIRDGYQLEFYNNPEDINSYQGATDFWRHYPTIGDSAGLRIRSDTFNTVGQSPSIYHPLEVWMPDYTTNVQTKKFWIRGDGIAEYAADYSAIISGSCDNCIPSKKWIVDNISGGGGGGSDSPDRINGIATGDVTADMGNNKFWINQSGSNSIRFASDDGAGNTSFFSMNGSGASFNYNDNEFNAELTGYRVVLDGTNTFTYDADYSANYTSLSLITKGDLDAAIAAVSGVGSSVDLASEVTGVLPAANGGTGVNNSTRTLTISGNAGTINFSAASKTLTVPLDASVSGTNTGDQTITLTGNVTGSGTGSFATTIAAGAVTNSMLAGSIAYSKLSLTGAILNADLAGSIAYSKLSLTGAILNADLAGSIAYSKLSLTGAILNADLAGSIAASKLVGTDIATVGTVTAGTINTRWKARVGSTTSSGTPTINTDNVDVYKLTAQAAAITSFTTNLSGTPNDGDVIAIEITDNGTARAITWGTSFVASTVALPTTTVISTTLTVVFRFSSTSSYGTNKWVCVNSF